MLCSEQRSGAALPDQVAFWNKWNAASREDSIDRVSLDQSETVIRWLGQLGRKDLDIIEVGCGAGWFCERLSGYGNLTATDLSHEVLERASKRNPGVKFIAGDFMDLDLPREAYDVVITLEVLSHVADQSAFVSKLASLLRTGGCLMMATQNRPQLESNDIPPPEPGQIRQWVDRHELRRLVGREFEIEELFSITPKHNRGLLRLLNSHKVNTALSSMRLGAVTRSIRSIQEDLWLGWTLMCLGKKR